MLECGSATRLIFTLGVLLLVVGVEITQGFILPPHWANNTLNPCAQKSWQMLHWPPDNKCYNIFSQGPCGETQEIYYDIAAGRAACRCSRGSAWHAITQRCHQIFSKGPCKYREYIKLKEGVFDEQIQITDGECTKYDECSPGQLFWPPTRNCFPHLTRGPCLHGHLLHIDPLTGSTKCGCDSTMMSINFWPHGDTCHELFTRGPCIQGHIFLYNSTIGQSSCVCNPALLTNYHPPTGRCYEVKTLGPCRQGQEFIFDPVTNRAKCECLEGYVEWRQTGQCYRIYTRGPCLPDHFLSKNKKTSFGECVKSSCLRGELYDPETNMCYLVGRRGPCQQGKLWVFERATSIRGSCQCDPHLIGYWPQHKICYELGEMGPCPKRRVLTYDKQTGELKCKCDIRRGYVPWVNGRCIIAGVKKDKLIPIVAPSDVSERGNSIHSDRIHRGLTLPLTSEEKTINSSRPTTFKNNIPVTIQEEILKDILKTLHNVSFTRTSTSISAEISRESVPSISVEVAAKNIHQTSARSSISDNSRTSVAKNEPLFKKTSPGPSNKGTPRTNDDAEKKEAIDEEITERIRKKLEEIKKRREGMLQTNRVSSVFKRRQPISESLARFYTRSDQERSGSQSSNRMITRRMVPLIRRQSRVLRS